MKIEFRKVPLEASDFEINFDSVKFLGTFSKISSKLAKIDAKIIGDFEVDCCKCGISFMTPIEEKIDFIVSDGIFTSSNDEDEEFVIIEVENHFLNFDEILHSEIESLKSEYYVCDTCKNNDQLVEIEY
ncbi:MAG: hypothetical protein U9Q20_00365 [Campylobacterota bacterium]|nr:hypothetical protein [Campylobacterota bacterium]